MYVLPGHKSKVSKEEYLKNLSPEKKEEIKLLIKNPPPESYQHIAFGNEIRKFIASHISFRKPPL